MTNRVILLGHLGRDPETKHFDNGGSVTTFSMATSERMKDDQGEFYDKTTWHNIAIHLERLGESVQKYLRKGRQVHVVGKLRHREFTPRDGGKAVWTEIVADEVTFLGGGRDDDRNGDDSGGGSNRDYGSRRDEPRRNPIDDDIPF